VAQSVGAGIALLGFLISLLIIRTPDVQVHAAGKAGSHDAAAPTP
jgi:hypothetical protein